MTNTISTTYLRILNNCLSGRSKKVFPNQVVFYNAVFGATNPAILPEDYLDDMERISRGERRAEDEELIKKVNYLLRSGLDSNSANVGKHINNAPEFPIPKQHKVHFLEAGNRRDIVRRLQTVIGFCLAFHPGRFRLDQADFAELRQQLRRYLPGGVSDALAATEEWSVEVLANTIYEVLTAHLAQVREPNFPIPGDGMHVKVDLARQREEYLNKVDCFCRNNIDRFFAMKRLAESNVVAANELACAYFYGTEYYEMDEGDGHTGLYRIEEDPDLAARYFRKAADCDPPVVSACWSLGYMIWNRMVADVRDEEAESLAFCYFNYAINRGYMPAYNSVGLIELAKGDAILEEEKRLQEQGQILPEESREEMLAHYCRGLELCDRAGCQGWVYGHINVANFLADENYAETVWPTIRDRLDLQGPMDLRERWCAAAAMENLWAMNQLALLDWRLGNIDSAAEIWEKAAAYHYPAASRNLALYIYGKDCPRSDADRYRRCLEKASADGSVKAESKWDRLHIGYL